MAALVQIMACRLFGDVDVLHFTDAYMRMYFRILVIDRFCFLIKIRLRFVPKGPIDNNP